MYSCSTDIFQEDFFHPVSCVLCLHQESDGQIPTDIPWLVHQRWPILDALLLQSIAHSGMLKCRPIQHDISCTSISNTQACALYIVILRLKVHSTYPSSFNRLCQHDYGSELVVPNHSPKIRDCISQWTLLWVTQRNGNMQWLSQHAFSHLELRCKHVLCCSPAVDIYVRTYVRTPCIACSFR